MLDVGLLEASQNSPYIHFQLGNLNKKMKSVFVDHAVLINALPEFLNLLTDHIILPHYEP